MILEGERGQQRGHELDLLGDRGTQELGHDIREKPLVEQGRHITAQTGATWGTGSVLLLQEATGGCHGGPSYSRVRQGAALTSHGLGKAGGEFIAVPAQRPGVHGSGQPLSGPAACPVLTEGCWLLLEGPMEHRPPR